MRHPRSTSHENANRRNSLLLCCYHNKSSLHKIRIALKTAISFLKDKHCRNLSSLAASSTMAHAELCKCTDKALGRYLLNPSSLQHSSRLLHAKERLNGGNTLLLKDACAALCTKFNLIGSLRHVAGTEPTIYPADRLHAEGASGSCSWLFGDSNVRPTNVDQRIAEAWPWRGVLAWVQISLRPWNALETSSHPLAQLWSKESSFRGAR